MFGKFLSKHLVIHKNYKFQKCLLKRISSNFNFNYKNPAFENYKAPSSVTVVRTKEHAKDVVNILKCLNNRFHAWDTETIDIDPKEQSPVGNGKVICLSCFAGPEVDFGNGPSKINNNFNLLYKI